MRAFRQLIAWLKEHPFAADGLLGASVFVFTTLVLFSGGECCAPDAEFRPPDVLAVGLLALYGGTLAWRRRAPMAVFVLVAASTILYEQFGNYPSNSGLAALIALYTVAAHCDRRRSLGALVATALILPVVLLSAEWEPDVATFISNYVIFGTAWLVGEHLKTRRAYVAELTERAERAERDREQDAARAVAEERTRIAREMHDVVAHAMSVMIVQTGGARRILERDPQRAAEALDAAEATGREAMAEMRTLLGVLRDDAPASRAPQPGLDRIPDLVEQCRSEDLHIELAMNGSGPPVPAGVDLAAYRIVQEALTNARKHAGPSEATVVVHRDADALVIEVTDDGRGASAPSDGAGQGLVGMRERVDLYGGELYAGPRPGGGFAVRARLPMAPGDN